MWDFVDGQWRVYNSLLDIDKAHLKLSDLRNKENYISILLDIIKSHGLCDQLGVRLLHKHNTIEFKEIMVCDAVINSNDLTLVTRATHLDTINQKFVASSWQSTNNGFLPLEYIYPDLVAAPNIGPSTNPQVFSEIAEALLDLKIAHIFGPTLMFSMFVESYSKTKDDILLEASDCYARANIMRYVNDTTLREINSQAIETSWANDVVGSGPGVRSKCKTRCSVPPEGGHQGTTWHERSLIPLS